MHTSLAELLETLKSGLLWVTRDGQVRYANNLASMSTGLSTGRKLWDPDLVRAVAAAVANGSARMVEAIGVASGGGAPPTLHCRVIPGLSRDDAFILIQNDAANDGSAFDRLMQVIDCDLREPLRQVRVAAGAAAGAPALASALQPLLQSLDTLVDLASVWRSDALLANDRIEPWPLLQRVWSEVEPLAQERRVSVRFVAQGDAASLATMYGSELWLRRVIQECLEAALRAARPGGTLHIEHRQLGPRALIVFRDSGVFAVPDATGLALPTQGKPASGRPQRLAAREQIGLELCRHVLALHGGQLREEQEDGQRNFLIDLPTGAPFRADQAAIDAAQVQQYARDLAELMARSRQRSASPRDTSPKPDGAASAPAAAPSLQPTTGAAGA